MDFKKRAFFVVFLLMIVLLSVTILVSCDKNEEYTIRFYVDEEEYYATTSAGMCRISMPADPTKKGYKFEGWYCDQDTFSISFSETSYLENYLYDDLRVYAKFTKEIEPSTKFKMYFDVDFEGEPVDPIVVTAGEYYENLPHVHRPGYTYKWMLGDKVIEEQQLIEITEDVTVKAVWAPIKYTISYNAEGGEIESDTQIVEFDSEVELAVPHKEGYTFVYWFSGNKIYEGGKWTTANDIQLRAKWFKGKGEFDENYKLVAFEYGEYPQTIKSSEVQMTITTDSRGYYLGTDGNYYKRVSAAKPCDTNYVFSNEETIVSDAEYYFKVEPIKWKVVEQKNGCYVVISQLILDNMKFYSTIKTRISNSGETIYPNNYKYSEIRKYLNDDFLNKAFKEEEQNSIQLTQIDNTPSSTGNISNIYTCEDTEDKIYLASYREVNEEKYSLIKNAKSSDYAKANGVYVYLDFENNSSWYLRSPIVDEETPGTSVYSVLYNGESASAATNSTAIGMRPLFNITFSL